MTVSEREFTKSSASAQDILKSNDPAKPEKRHRLCRSLTGNFTQSRSLLYSPTNQSPTLLHTRNSLDIIPHTNKPIPSLPSYRTRPVLVKNTYANISSRPSKFVKPAAQHQYSLNISPTDLESIAKLFLRYNHKLYAEGYLSTLIEITADEHQTHGPHWKQVYAELSGSTLAIWDAEKSNRQEDILPSYINITDAVLEIIEQQVFGKSNCFAIQNTAGANRFIFQAITQQDLKKWETCFWLASFEGTKLHEMYTRTILSRPTYKPLFTKQPSNGLEGYLQVRFASKSDWQRFWAVLDKKDENKLWGRRTQSPFPGSVLLYDDKKSKTPVMSVTNVARAYAIYPENPQLYEHATMFKIEGSVISVSKDGNHNIPERISHVLFMAKNNKELSQWLMATFDVFKLYGRPQQPSFHHTQLEAINNADAILRTPGKLFLDVPEVQEKGLCDRKRWDHKGIFADELQRKLDALVELVTVLPRIHTKSRSLSPSELSAIQSRMSSMELSPTTDSTIDQENIQVSPAIAEQERISTITKQIGDSSDDDTEDDITGQTDEEDSDDSSTFNLRTMTDVAQQTPASPKQKPLEAKQLSRHTSNSSSFLLDFGNLSGSRNNMNSGSSSSAASSSSIFGDFAHSIDFSKYIDTSVLNDEAAASNGNDPDMANMQTCLGNSQSFMGASHSYVDNNIDPAASKKEAGSSLPKQRSRMFFPPWNWGMFGNYYEEEYNHQQEEYAKQWKSMEDMKGREGPPIPSLGDRFASQNSLLDFKPSELPMTAQEQTAYARATRQPFLHVPVKQKDPKAGLIGKITQLESDRKDSGKRVAEKVNAYNAELEKERFFERERDRRLMEQRQQQMFQQVSLYAPGRHFITGMNLILRFADDDE